MCSALYKSALLLLLLLLLLLWIAELKGGIYTPIIFGHYDLAITLQLLI